MCIRTDNVQNLKLIYAQMHTTSNIKNKITKTIWKSLYIYIFNSMNIIFHLMTTLFNINYEQKSKARALIFYLIFTFLFGILQIWIIYNNLQLIYCLSNA